MYTYICIYIFLIRSDQISRSVVSDKSGNNWNLRTCMGGSQRLWTTMSRRLKWAMAPGKAIWRQEPLSWDSQCVFHVWRQEARNNNLGVWKLMRKGSEAGHWWVNWGGWSRSIEEQHETLCRVLRWSCSIHRGQVLKSPKRHTRKLGFGLKQSP